MALDLVTPFTKVQLEEEIKDTGRKQVGILGGNFNPVHNAHLVVADQVRQQLGLDEVLLMPEFEPPHVDKKETINEQHRLNMIMLAINGIEGLDIETIELERFDAFLDTGLGNAPQQGGVDVTETDLVAKQLLHQVVEARVLEHLRVGVESGDGA